MTGLRVTFLFLEEENAPPLLCWATATTPSLSWTRLRFRGSPGKRATPIKSPAGLRASLPGPPAPFPQASDEDLFQEKAKAVSLAPAAVLSAYRAGPGGSSEWPPRTRESQRPRTLASETARGHRPCVPPRAWDPPPRAAAEREAPHTHRQSSDGRSLPEAKAAGQDKAPG